MCDVYMISKPSFKVRDASVEKSDVTGKEY